MEQKTYAVRILIVDADTQEPCFEATMGEVPKERLVVPGGVSFSLDGAVEYINERMKDWLH
jgi:hypothetical protein